MDQIQNNPGSRVIHGSTHSTGVGYSGKTLGIGTQQGASSSEDFTHSTTGSKSSGTTYIGDNPPFIGGQSETPVNNEFGMGFCQHRLPCGICEKLGYMCPMMYNKMEITCGYNKSET